MKKLFIYSGIAAFLIIVFLVVADFFILPAYVEAREVVVPRVIGLDKSEAIKILTESGLNPIEGEIKFDENFEVDEILFQKPLAGSTVKEGRRIYLVVSGGDPKITMPRLLNKTLRDVEVTLSKFDLYLAEIKKEGSERERGTVIEQFPEVGDHVIKGDSVYVVISDGPRRGQVRTPLIMGKTLEDSKQILQRASLRLGNVKRRISPQLPNTVIHQEPSQGQLLSIGDSVDVVITVLK
ncbi:MAG: PASTA domain-containing protein [Melioribacteraceae bacterium]|nr:PASTA domain-containing protein [Melioribacteraceae bacterium]